MNDRSQKPERWNSSRRPSVPPASRWRAFPTRASKMLAARYGRGATTGIVFTAAFVVVAGLVALKFRPSPSTPTPAPSLTEVTRRDLVLTNGVNFRRGETAPFTGLLTERYASGALRSRSAITNGLLNGASLGWHTNGQMQVEEHFVNGISHGPRTRWFISGMKESEATIVHGVMEGTFRKWHANGALAQEITLSNGVPHGLSRAWRPDGTLLNEVELHGGRVIAKTTQP